MDKLLYNNTRERMIKGFCLCVFFGKTTLKGLVEDV